MLGLLVKIKERERERAGKQQRKDRRLFGVSECQALGPCMSPSWCVN